MGNGSEKMSDKEILKEARAVRGITQVKLAERMGTKQNALSANMLRARTSTAMFTKILDALGYDVVVVDRESGSAEWKVDPEKFSE